MSHGPAVVELSAGHGLADRHRGTAPPARLRETEFEATLIRLDVFGRVRRLCWSRLMTRMPHQPSAFGVLRNRFFANRDWLMAGSAPLGVLQRDDRLPMGDESADRTPESRVCETAHDLVAIPKLLLDPVLVRADELQLSLSAFVVVQVPAVQGAVLLTIITRLWIPRRPARRSAACLTQCSRWTRV